MQVREAIMKLGAVDHAAFISPLHWPRRFGLDSALTEQIVRLSVTHPGVSVDGIMTKMGL